jgi:hypothetical protein
MKRLLHSLLSIAFVTLMFGVTAEKPRAAGLSEALSSVNTGPFKDAACKATIEAVVGAVDGLGAGGISNVKVEDDAISGDLSLPVGGDWSIYLFATDCSKSGFAVFKPKSDLKISDLVGSVPGLDEVDKLGLSGQGRSWLLSAIDQLDVPTAVWVTVRLAAITKANTPR